MTESHFTVVSGPHYPLSVRLAFLLIVAFLFIGMPTARRNAFPLLALSMPIWSSWIAVFLQLASVAAGQSLTGAGGRHATAAGVADAHIPLKWSFYVIAFICFLYSARHRGTEGHVDRRCIGVLLCFLAALAPLDLWFAHELLLPISTYHPWKVQMALAFAFAAGLLFLLCLGTVVRGRRAEPHLSRTAAMVFGSAALLAGLFMRHLIIDLQNFAMGP